MILQVEGRYLTFSLAGREYGVEVQKVREILEPSCLEPLSGAELNVRWVLRLRGRVVPVVDLRRRFGLAPTGAFPHQCIVTVVVRGWDGPFLMGLLVDGVREVVQVWSKDLVEGMAGEGREQCLLGPVQCQDRPVLLLDVDALSEEEAVQGFQSNFGRMS